MMDKLKAGFIALLPTHAISRIVFRLSRCRVPFVKNNLIRIYLRLFDIDLSQARESDPFAYSSWNAFFTRALRDDARPVDPDSNAIVSPVDGTISQIGYLDDRQIVQAKGHYYSVEALLGDQALGDEYKNGAFVTIYLSPRDYHRIHMPCSGKLQRMLHIPGRLYSVAPHTVNTIEGMFAKNERVVTLFDTDCGSLSLTLVGAINVGAIETIWAGLVTPPAGREVSDISYDIKEQLHIEKGHEMGRFNLGSTVILVFQENQVKWLDTLKPGDRLLMGQLIGQVSQ
jgi:phosphatidylserine decarboxylase